MKYTAIFAVFCSLVLAGCAVKPLPSEDIEAPVINSRLVSILKDPRIGANSKEKYDAIRELMKKVDYKTLIFFIGLFVVIGGLEQTGILEIMAGFIGKICGGNVWVMIAIIIWLSAIASAFVDNIPFATTMIPIIKSLSAAFGVDLPVLAWTLAMGTDIGGSATPIGASANVVGIATAAREGYVIKWGTYCKKMVPATLIVVFISMIVIYLRYL